MCTWRKRGEKKKKIQKKYTAHPRLSQSWSRGVELYYVTFLSLSKPACNVSNGCTLHVLLWVLRISNDIADCRFRSTQLLLSLVSVFAFSKYQATWCVFICFFLFGKFRSEENRRRNGNELCDDVFEIFFTFWMQ